jgi:peptide/nickel transport system substrate-binding protein
VAAGLLLVVMSGGGALAQKPGGVLRIYHRDSPASMSIHEEGTNSVSIPMMAVFNNLVLYDQHVAQNSLDTIVPDLAESWSWSEDGTRLTFKLHEGIKWHDGEPFTSADVKCTRDLLTGRTAERLRANPRKSWWNNVAEIATDGPGEAAFVSKRPQPAILALIASGYTPIYPCHVSPRDMRQHPIGTGPFKFLEFKPNESIKLTRNPDYWNPGRPYLDGIDTRSFPTARPRSSPLSLASST